jgi:hypothetical protein
MRTKPAKQALVWGGTLILVGVLSLVNQFVELSAWVWAGMFALAGLGALGLYLSDRSDWAMLLATYVVWALALLIALTGLNVLRGDAVAFYVLSAVALPFLAVFVRDRAQWWAVIPAYILLAVAVMIWLIGRGVLGDLLIPSYVLFAVALPFFVVYARDRSQWWALIPGGIMAVVGLSFLIAEGGVETIGAIVLILIGVGMLVRLFTRRAPPAEAAAGPPEPDAPATTGPEDAAHEPQEGE